ncbi:hypothetical protein ACEQ8H_004382 [Pleosporales sp. CAS-2024a]
MEVVANGLAVVSIAFQLSEACVKLYRFWESIEEAPHEISAIKEDLRYLISILSSIVKKLENGFQSGSRKKRWCTAFKAATHSKHVEKFRKSLNETIATLTLAMVHEWYAL